MSYEEDAGRAMELLDKYLELIQSVKSEAGDATPRMGDIETLAMYTDLIYTNFGVGEKVAAILMASLITAYMLGRIDATQVPDIFNT